MMPFVPWEHRGPGSAAASGAPQVWILDNQQPKAIPVQTGESNGRSTEIVAADLKPGMALIAEYQEPKP